MMWKQIMNFFLSLKLTVTLLGLSMVLVLAGTLAQVDQGIWTVVDQYFRTLVAWIDLPVFFPRHWPVPPWRIPFPGGSLIGGLLVLNLLAVHAKTFKVLTQGRRRMMGFVLLSLGILVMVGVMLGWGTAPVAATEQDAFWRVFLRLGRGSLAAVLLYGACVLLYAKRAGLVLMHVGILFLLVGESFTALFAVEASMTIKEGETVGFVDHSRSVELAFTEVSHPAFDEVTVIPQHKLKAGAEVAPEALPFVVKVNRFMKNSTPPRGLGTVPPDMLSDYPTYQGYGSRLYVGERPENAGASGAKNAPAVDVELVDPESGASLGRYIFTLWFYPNFVNRQWDMPETIRVGQQVFSVYLRSQREYLTSAGGHPFSIELQDFVHERYEGTQMPKDFSSRIRLVNEGEEVDRELRIWMNNPLRYARRTFYQSGYLPDDSGTVLQVVRNDSWMIPYLACMMVFVGMTGHFLQSLRRFVKSDA